MLGGPQTLSTQVWKIYPLLSTHPVESCCTNYTIPAPLPYFKMLNINVLTITSFSTNKSTFVSFNTLSYGSVTEF